MFFQPTAIADGQITVLYNIMSNSRRMVRGDRNVVYCFLSVTLSTKSTKSTKFGSRYLVDKLSEAYEIWHIGSSGLAADQCREW